jgi:hypothetical protein
VLQMLMRLLYTAVTKCSNSLMRKQGSVAVLWEMQLMSALVYKRSLIVVLPDSGEQVGMY